MHHFSVHGFDRNVLPYGVDLIFVDFFAIGGKLGVDLFVLISGYFLVNSVTTLKKFLKIVGQVWIYSVSILLFFLFICPVRLEISNHEIFHYFFPILYSVNWFATTYVCLLMITPVLNILLKKLTKRQLEIFLLSFLLFQSLLPTILQTSYQLNELGWFIVLYFIAAYLRNHCQLSTGNWRNHLLIAVILYFMLWGFYTYSEKYMYENSFLVILIALELFLAFIKLGACI